MNQPKEKDVGSKEITYNKYLASVNCEVLDGVNVAQSEEPCFVCGEKTELYDVVGEMQLFKCANCRNAQFANTITRLMPWEY